MKTFEPNWKSPPGDTIKDIIDEKNIPIKVFLDKMDMSLVDIMKLLDGNIIIDENIASKLSDVLGSSKEFWLNREKQYRQG
jgi:HTH-type transcriptional regulator / antitoxin HigA